MACQVIAHRGASGHAPENTLAAFRLAVEQGADGLELDVQRTRDGALVVCHDATIDRTTDGRGRIADLTLAELRRHSAGAWYDPAFAAERIPTLEEVLEVVPDGMLLNIEIKHGPDRFPGIAEQVADAVRSCGKALDVLISSFDHACLLDVQGAWPGVRIGVLYEAYLVDPWRYVRSIGLAASSVHPHWAFTWPEFVAAARREGMAVYPWGMVTDEEVRRMAEAGVDGVIVNHPDRARRLLG
ncbi:MAG: glycerophosphodiester phosphodiesterase [Alicyclobacillus sp.]|nr:glycerophosphodiester phosphodiesterase [Alicyclobacillus sp.]